MDIRTLKYFLAVAREENITKAAEALHVTQPTLSRQLAALEEELNVRLMVRGKNGIMLTDEGVLLRRRVQELTELADKTVQELSVRDETLEGLVSIGSGECVPVHFLPKWFEAFREKYPRVQFDLYTGNADQIRQRLDTGLVDLGIMIEPVEVTHYNFIRFPVSERWVVLMRPDSPLAAKDSVTITDLIDLPLVFVSRRVIRNELESWFHGYLEQLNIVATSNMSTNACVLVSQGFGYALITEGSVPFLDQRQVCHRPLSPERTSGTILAWKKNQPFSPLVKRFLEFVQQQLNEWDQSMPVTHNKI